MSDQEGSEGKMEKKKRYDFIDYLNILACLCVIFMHCNGIVHRFEYSRAWKESMFVEAAAYWAVPVFFMISGATLMGYRDKYSTGTFFKKRVLKTVFPFIAWVLINLIFKTAAGIMEPDLSLSGIVDMFNNTTTENVYWFFIPLFMCYLSMPVLSLLKDNKRVLIYMAAGAFLVYSVYPMVCTFLKIGKNSAVIFPTAGGYLLFVILGYLLTVTELSKKLRIAVYIMGCLGFALRFGFTVAWSADSGALNQTFWGYLNFPSVFLATGVFVLARSIHWDRYICRSSLGGKAVSAIAGAGFGVYLMHMIVYRILQHITGLSAHSYLWRFGMPFVIYGICVLATVIMKKIPVVRRLVP